MKREYIFFVTKLGQLLKHLLHASCKCQVILAGIILIRDFEAFDVLVSILRRRRVSSKWVCIATEVHILGMVSWNHT